MDETLDCFDVWSAAYTGDEDDMVAAIEQLPTETVHLINHAAQRLLDATAVELDERYAE